ncbi:OPT family oligopeptide transporter [Actinobacillus suis]|uniref:Oligopeptide transporter n=2 Tax=Actinobacillus suis TaxID=716 RepID=K0FZP2_ACTSU|nr:oligopeptide transporter, OPT family [Actinobacillus suis]AFU20042.1 oligopeptide transporter [Actinobacillus suis H91-0380]AIJ32181.1 oligopeptide transporter, OPT family [Actinobacillus suis ATCC 33415]MCO4167843.1 oligopeptide transporter, OPT family [Actinobacillus suis]MCO4169733.1 oligopeptide transporter, OPT family [Actinobacillus suis]MCQ9630780.1 oligopeptide transporter, OPT family [Actinobacillus suis]
MHNPTALRELTLRGMILGALITVVFTASNVYLGLKVGMTFASSIPAAVISMAVLKMFKGSNILENNMVQTQASSAGTLSSVIFVIPALLMMGYWQNFPFWQTLLICISGGILGVIFTVPLRNVMVVKSDLPYPEGVAAAEILKAGDEADSKDSGVKEIVSGGLLAALVSFLTNGLRVVADGTSYWFKGGNAIFQLPMGFSFALLGAGYLVGMMGGIAMLVGTIFTWGVAVPYFTATTPMPADADMVSFAMGLWKSKVRFIGVGTIGIAAIWTLLVLFKPMLQGMSQAFRALKDPTLQNVERTAQDLSPKTMIYTVLASVALIIIALVSFLQPVGLPMELAFLLVVLCTVLAVVVGFLVAAASGYMAGLVGSSSSPISGIGIISIVIISLVLMVVGNTIGLMENADGQRFLTALTIFTASIVFCVSTISNDNLQDLKTGYLVKATPWRQQFALIIGCIVGAFVITPVLEILYHAYGFAGAMPREGMDAAQALSAPQATIMMTISNGIFSNSLEWTYILVGVAFGICLIIVDTLLKKASAGRLGLPTLAVGIGIYLPPVVNVPLIIGALLSWLVNRHIQRHAKRNGKDVEAASKKAERYGTLFAAGLIVGESLVGVLLAFVIAGSVTSGGSDAPLALNLENWGGMAELLGLVLFVIGCIIFARRVLQAKK